MTDLQRALKEWELKRFIELIDMLKWDIDMFWPSSDDLARLSEYKKQIDILQKELSDTDSVWDRTS